MTNTNSIYPKAFARFYDIIYQEVRTEPDKEFYLKKSISAGGPVLELGTGTGRFFIEALKNSVDIYGIDNSDYMLDVLRKRLDYQEHHRLFCEDIINFNIIRKFKLIIAPFRVFAHILTIENQLKAIQAISNHLEPDGRFIFDLFVPNPTLLAQGLNNHIDFEGEYEKGEKVRRCTSMHADIVNQKINISMLFEWTEKGKLLTETWESQLHLFFKNELELLFDKSPLQIEKICGDFDENLITSNSKEMIIFCKLRA